MRLLRGAVPVVLDPPLSLRDRQGAAAARRQRRRHRLHRADDRARPRAAAELGRRGIDAACCTCRRSSRSTPRPWPGSPRRSIASSPPRTTWSSAGWRASVVEALFDAAASSRSPGSACPTVHRVRLGRQLAGQVRTHRRPTHRGDSRTDLTGPRRARPRRRHRWPRSCASRSWPRASRPGSSCSTGRRRAPARRCAGSAVRGRGSARGVLGHRDRDADRPVVHRHPRGQRHRMPIQTGDVMYTHYKPGVRHGHPDAGSGVHWAYDRYVRPTTPGAPVDAGHLHRLRADRRRRQGVLRCVPSHAAARASSRSRSERSEGTAT